MRIDAVGPALENQYIDIHVNTKRNMYQVRKVLGRATYLRHLPRGIRPSS